MQLSNTFARFASTKCASTAHHPPRHSLVQSPPIAPPPSTPLPTQPHTIPPTHPHTPPRLFPPSPSFFPLSPASRFPPFLPPPSFHAGIPSLNPRHVPSNSSSPTFPHLRSLIPFHSPNNHTSTPVSLVSHVPYTSHLTTPTATPLPTPFIHSLPFPIYNNLSEIPSQLLSPAHTPFCHHPSHTRGWKAYMCGRRCEHVLLSVTEMCKKGASCDGMNCAPTLVECQKVRRFRRCYDRVCFRGGRGRRPNSFQDGSSITIVRVQRPPGRLDALFAGRNRPFRM